MSDPQQPPKTHSHSRSENAGRRVRHSGKSNGTKSSNRVQAQKSTRVIGNPNDYQKKNEPNEKSDWSLKMTTSSTLMPGHEKVSTQVALHARRDIAGRTRVRSRTRCHIAKSEVLSGSVTFERLHEPYLTWDDDVYNGEERGIQAARDPQQCQQVNL